jgi:IS5 family transposase
MLTDSSSSEDMQNCIKQMRKLNSKNVEDLLKTALLAHRLGIEYRMEWLSV